MKNLIILLSILFSSVAGMAQINHSKMKENVDTVQQTKYTCTMHPEVVQNQPGKCPKCGMTLVKKVVQENMNEKYTCSMHPEVISDKPGKCPKCEMDLVKMKSKSKKHKMKNMKMDMMNCMKP